MMKADPRRPIVLGFAALASLPMAALAIEAPDDNAPPPSARGGDPAAAPVADTAFLGVATLPVPEMLGCQLGLDPGHGIVVRTVLPGGPAARAGVAPHDVIVRVGGKDVATHDDLARIVREHKPGDTLAIDLIHQGKPATRKANLAGRPENVADGPEPMDNLMLEDLPGDQGKRIREMIERQLRAFEGGGGAGADDAVPMLHGDMKKLEEFMRGALQQGLDGAAFGSSEAKLSMMDQDGSIEFSSDGKGREASVRDKAGKVVWSGPWNNENDKAAAPPDVRARLEKANLDMDFKGAGLRFQFGGAPNGPARRPQPPANGPGVAAEPAAPEGGPME